MKITLDSLFGYDLPQADVVKFLASLKEKHIGQYYSILETSVSKSENKRHDKRWFKVDSFPFTLSSPIECHINNATRSPVQTQAA